MEFLRVVVALKLPLTPAQLNLLIDSYFKTTLCMGDLADIVIEEEIQSRILRSGALPTPVAPQPPPQASVNYQPEQAPPQPFAEQFVPTPTPVQVQQQTILPGTTVEGLDPALIAQMQKPRSPIQKPVNEVPVATIKQGTAETPAIIVNGLGLIANQNTRGVQLTPEEIAQIKRGTDGTGGGLGIMPIAKVGDPNRTDSFVQSVGKDVKFITKPKTKQRAVIGGMYDPKRDPNSGMDDYTEEEIARFEAQATTEATNLKTDLEAGDIDVAVTPPLRRPASSAANSIRGMLNGGHAVVDGGRSIQMPRLSNPAGGNVITSANSVISPKLVQQP
jgi:hypothetical protein